MLLQQVLEELSPISSPPPQQQQQEEEQDKSESPTLVRTLDVKRSAPLTRHTLSTNAHYLYRAAIAAKDIQSSSHGRLSAPALLANCLLSMISLSDDDDDDNEHTNKIEGDPVPAAVEDGRNIILKSFSQLHAEERNSKEALINHRLQGSNHKKLEIISCCLFPCKRNISSKSMGSTVELLQSSDELSSSNDDGNSRSRVRVVGEGGGGAWAPCNLRSFMKRVLCKGSSEASAGSSIGDHEMIYDDDQQGLSAWAGTPISNQSHVYQEDDHNVDHEYMYNNAHSLLHVGNAGGYGAGIFAKAGRSTGTGTGTGTGAGAAAYSVMSCGSCAEAAAQEVVHEASITPSHDTPIASSFVFEQSCFSSSSSTSSTSHCMKLVSAHPWLISAADIDFCNTSPHHHHHVHSDANPNDPSPNHALLVMQDDLQLRLANKRLNLSR